MSYFSKILSNIYSLFHNTEKKLSSFGKWAIITGASDGIGKAIAKELINENLSLILIGRNEEKLRIALLSLKGKGSDQEIRYLLMDFTDPTCYSSFSKYLDNIKDIGVLVNNVGVSYPFAQYFEEIGVDLINELIEVNVRSVLMMTHIVYSYMKKNGSSQLQSDPLYSAYAATKSVSESLCRSLMAECESKNIVIQCHTPMLVTTKLSKVNKETFFTISAERFAMDSIRELKRPQSAYTTIVPYFGHKLQLIIANLIPRQIWNKIRISQTRHIRERALKKIKMS
ncbi:putative steroid dehydrogenase kik-i [Cryptosporidium canis]|uniref:Steroid dehydrogenase kik-i n=1 Tax=Cryptosporidium canis TaxID=195482 RepID=A0A9D5HW84_9CRYT|nr:putative steroid dehydrogenase kik-i [Cryptosporidium canis]